MRFHGIWSSKLTSASFTKYVEVPFCSDACRVNKFYDLSCPMSSIKNLNGSDTRTFTSKVSLYFTRCEDQCTTCANTDLQKRNVVCSDANILLIPQMKALGRSRFCPAESSKRYLLVNKNWYMDTDTRFWLLNLCSCSTDWLAVAYV